MEEVKETIPQGYKQTDIGVIPENWDLVSYDSAFDFLRTASYSRAMLSRDKDVGYIHYGDIHTKWDNILEFNHDLPTIDNNQLNNYDLVKHGDLVMADASEDYNGIGKSIEIKNKGEIKAISGLHTFLLRDKGGVFASGYRGYIHNNVLVKRSFDRLATGLKVYGLSKSSLKTIQIPVPPKPEQVAIASILSDTDILIKNLEKLIAKKKAIKQGVMQNLLTGEKRLPGFSGEWKEKTIKQIEQIPVSDGPHLTPNFVKYGIPFLSVNNLVDYKISFKGMRYISNEDHLEFSKKCRPQKGDILLGKAASVGLVAVIEVDDEINVWSPIAVIRLQKDYDPKFFLYSFQAESILKQIKFLTNSSSQGNLGMGDIEKIKFLVPQKQEQTAIAIFLSEIDAEIECIKNTLEKYQLIKSGMMQQLLTGKIRLV